MNNTLSASTWQRDDDAYDPQARVRQFTFKGRQFTAHSLHADGPDQWPMTVREAVTRRYVATVLNWRRLPEELAKALQPQPQSGYATCACRDCFEIFVANNPARPELCDDCNHAGCGDPDATTWPECLRDDAYEG